MISISEKEKDIIGIEESNLEDDIKATLENPNETYVVEFETLFQGAFVDNFEAILKNLYKLLDAEVKNEEDLVQANISPLKEETFLMIASVLRSKLLPVRIW